MKKRTKQRKKVISNDKKARFDEIVANQEDFEGLVKKVTYKPKDEKDKKKSKVKSDIVKV